MSRRYSDVSDYDSGEEGVLIVDEAPVATPSRRGGGRKRAASPPVQERRKRARAKPLVSEEEEDEAEETAAAAARPARRKGEDGEEEEGARPPRPVTPSLAVARPLLQLDAQEQKWQRAMDLAAQMLVPLKVDVKGLTLLPDGSTLECFRRGAQAWLNERKISCQLTFSTQKSLLTVMARFLLDFVVKAAGLKTPEWNPCGCVIWQHRSGSEGLHCLHGLPMINKEQLVEMDLNSENGQRALRETPERAKITTNRWGRNVVQLRNDGAMCCSHDVGSAPNTFSARSCGLFYSEGSKAQQAFEQLKAFQKACYPRMGNAETHLLMPLVCDCGWGCRQVPLLGRQTCKITPFALSGSAALNPQLVEDPKILASVTHPAVLVFQCYNPVYRGSRGNPQKNCDFKISAPDVMLALQLTKQMWAALMQTRPPLTVPEFKWGPQFQVQNTIFPVGTEDDDESLF